MTGATDAPEALWYWQTDQGHWHVYPDALCESLEDAWKNKVTRFPVDAERFVDTVKMVQRRLDMTGKQRSVKRELQLALLKHVFAFAGPLKTNVAPLVSDHGGIITPYITTKISYLVCDQPLTVPDMLAEAKELSIPVVSSAAIHDIVKYRAKADLKQHIVDLSKLSIIPTPDGVTGSWGASNSNHTTNKANGKAVDAITMPKPNGLPWKNGYTRLFDVSTQWLGALSVSGSEHAEPVQLDVTHFTSAGEWIGLYTNFKTMTCYQIKGILIPGGGPPMEDGDLSHTIYIQFVHLVSGNDKRLDQVLRKGNLDTCSRSINFDELSFTYTRHIPIMPMPFLQPGTTWQGTAATESSPLTLEISKTNPNGSFEGSVTWSDLDVKTSCTGQIKSDNQIMFEETGTLSAPDDEFDMPNTKYICRPATTLSPEEKVSQLLGTWSSITDGTQTAGTIVLKHVK